MGLGLVSKDEIRNIIVAAQQVSVELAKRAPSSVEMETYLDGFMTALEVIATGLGVEVIIERPLPSTPRKWREVWDVLPASAFGEYALPSQDDD